MSIINTLLKYELSLIINEYYDTLMQNEKSTDKIALLLIKKLYVKNIIENFRNDRFSLNERTENQKV